MPKAKSKREAKRLTDLVPDTKSKRPSKSTSKPTSKSTPTSTSKTIILYAPSIDITERFTFPTSQHPSEIVANILTALSLKVGFAYDLHHRPVTNYTELQPDQTLLIATCYFERPLAEKKRSVLIAQSGPAERAWGKLSAEEKRSYVRERREKEHGDEDVVRLTLPLSSALERFDAAQSPTPVSTHLARIQEHWGLPLDAVLGLRGMYMPYEELEKWQEGLLETLAVLSEATIGQGDLVAGWVVERMKERKGKIVEKEDMEELGRVMYREALMRTEG